MPTSTSHNPFAPKGTVEAKDLQRYLAGFLAPQEMQRIEQHLEADPLLRDALDGLRATAIQRPFTRTDRPGGSGSWRPLVLVGAGILATTLVFWLHKTPEQARTAQDRGPKPVDHPVTTHDLSIEQEAFLAEVEDAVEVPESLHVGSEGSDLHDRTIDAGMLVDRDPPLDSMLPKRIKPPLPELSRTGPINVRLRGRRLLYLHDLKVVDPGELYSTDPMMLVDDNGTDARFATAEERLAHTSEQGFIAYVPYMDQVLLNYSQGRYKKALQELAFLLEQYPDDVNALFYSGLACYDLGLYGRAEGFLQRAGHHPVDSFQEEALWYHARSVESAEGPAKALPLYQAIAAGKGFYAERAERRSAR